VKITRLLVLVAFFGISCSVALADGVDPVFKLGPGGASINLTSDTFSFTVSKADATIGILNFDFINSTGAVIQELDLFANSSAFLFSCDPTGNPYFNNCSPQSPTGGPTTLKFLGFDETHHGIPNAAAVECDGPTHCTVEEGDPNSDFIITVAVADMPVGSSFDVTGTLVPVSAPEPSTMLLLLAAGLGFLVVKRSAFAI